MSAFSAVCSIMDRSLASIFPEVECSPATRTWARVTHSTAREQQQQKTRSVSHSTSNFPFQQNRFLHDLLVRRMVPFQVGHSLQCQPGIRRIVIDKGPGIEQVKNFSRSVPNRHRASQKGIDNLFRNVTLPVGMLHDQGKAVVQKDIFVERPLLVGDVYGAGI